MFILSFILSLLGHPKLYFTTCINLCHQLKNSYRYHDMYTSPSLYVVKHFTYICMILTHYGFWLSKDWEEGLCETDAGGSFLYGNGNKNLQLFSDSDNGGKQLLQVYFLA